MFSEEMIKQVSGFFSLIEEIEQKLMDTCLLEKQSRQGELALVFNTEDGRPLLYFGIQHELWMRYQQPFWYGVSTAWQETVVTAFSSSHEGLITCRDYRLCPLPHNLVSPAENIPAIAAFLEEKISTLKAAGEE